MQTFETNEDIIVTGSKNNLYYLLMEGTVDAYVGGRKYVLKKGDVVGIFDITLPTHICSYRAASACSLIPYAFKSETQFIDILNLSPKLRRLMILSVCRNIYRVIYDTEKLYMDYKDFREYLLQTHDRYHNHCMSLGLSYKVLPFMENFSSLPLEEALPFWMKDYYYSMDALVSGSEQELSTPFVYGFLVQGIRNIEHVISTQEKLTDAFGELSAFLLNDDYLDFFDLYCDLFFRAKNNEADASPIENRIREMAERILKTPYIDSTLAQTRIQDFESKVLSFHQTPQEETDDKDLTAELANSLNTILDYSDTMSITASEFKKYLEQYKNMADKNATDQDSAHIRMQLTRLFYLIYYEVFQVSLKSEDVPVVIKMFLNFGYVDPFLCGYKNAVALYKITQNYHGNKEQGIYTIYEWIREIYLGNKQPSRNEFEQDYNAYIRNLKKEGKINREAELDMYSDTVGKVMYELQNMLPSVNKITCGRVMTFCPILIEENICKPLEELLLSPNQIHDVLQRLNQIDYSVFYHDMMYEETAFNAKETVRIDIRPDIILMPNIGSKGILWQEIEGMKRDTPGRMMISAFHMENLDKTFIRMMGEFRWEMCKRSQGARWNDITSHSLTSDYCDYAQFFQKNRDLSYEAKDKIRTNLKRAKNSFRELFLIDYMIYMMYESTGSCRLNRVCRSILFKYCPFGKEARTAISGNTIFSDCLDKHKLVTAQTLHHLKQLNLKYQNAGVPVPDVIAIQSDLVSR